MPRDFARKQPRRRSQRSPQAPSRKGPFLTGLTLGLGVALFVWLVDHGYVSPEMLWSDEQGGSAAVLPESAPVTRPRFDFYTILPEMEVVIPEEMPSEAAPPTSHEPRPAQVSTIPVAAPAVAGAGGYILQAGSFRSVADAEALKASLALLGFEANVQRVSINQDTYHRVRVGPYRDREAAGKARARLRNNAVDTLLLRLKG